MMRLIGVEVSLAELANVKNVATVIVTATVPAAGARQGQKLNCNVSAISAKSLAGGKFVLTTLTGPNPIDKTVYALASGSIYIDKNGSPTSGRVNNGCQLEVDFRNAYSMGGKFTLVIDQRFASFHTAFDVEDLINNPSGASSDAGTASAERTGGKTAAKAIDQVNIEVTIPSEWQDDPIEYISQVLNSRIQTPIPDASVVIDKGNGVLVIGDNVLVGRVAVSIDTLSVQTGPGQTAGPISIIDQEDETQPTKLDALVAALKALQVETKDIIAIVEAIHAETQHHPSSKLNTENHRPMITNLSAVDTQLHARQALLSQTDALTSAKIPRPDSELLASGDPQRPSIREAFNDFVGQTFYGQLIGAMRTTVGKPAYFHGGRSEEIFQAQMDQQLAEHMSDATAETFTGPMYELFSLKRN